MNWRGVLALVLLFLSVGASALYLSVGPEPEEAAVPVEDSVSAEQVRARASALTERDSRPGSTANTLLMPAPPSPSDLQPIEALDRPEIRSLPRLTPQTVSAAVLKRAEELARQYPDDEWLKEYLAHGYLLHVGQSFRRKSLEDALRAAQQAERYGASPANLATFRAMIYYEQDELDLATTWADVGLAYGEGADPALLHFIVGKVHYKREELDKAVRRFQASLDVRRDSNVQTYLDRARKENRVASGFDRRRLSHFIVRYEGDSMEDTGRMVLDALERSFTTLKIEFAFEPSNPVVVILYSRRSYSEMGGPHWSAGYFDGKIRVPVRGLERLDQHLIATLHHELAHAFIHEMAGEKCPRWLQEGIAEYAEGTRTETFGRELAGLLEQSGGLSHCIITARCDVQVFYWSSASLVEFIHQRRGMPGLREILTKMGEGKSVDQAVREVTGKDQLGVMQDWEHFIRRRYS